MSGERISALPPIPSSQLTDIFPAVQVGITYKTTISQLSTLFNTSLAFLPITGGTMMGVINMGGFIITGLPLPSIGSDAVNKTYADTIVGGGFTVILAADAATTANLIATQAGAGVGATLTNAGVQVALVVDGFVTTVGKRILVKNQSLPQHNGVYVVTDIGSGATNWILTRALDYDTPAEIQPGTLIAVDNGTVNGLTSWLETATVVTVDTDPILFSQFTFQPGAFFLIANNLSEGVPATMRTNLGLGTVATKTASDNAQTIAAMVNGATVIGHIAVFSDVTGTIIDGGVPASGTVTSVGTAGLATGGPITTTGTVTVTGAVKATQEAATSTTTAVVPGVQQFHPSAAKAWARWQGNPVVIKASYNVTSIVRNSIGNYTITFTTAFSGANNYAVLVGSSNNSGNTNGTIALNYTANTITVIAEDGSGFVDAANINMVAFGAQ